MNDTTANAPRFGKIEATTVAQALPSLGYKYVKLMHRNLLSNGLPNTALNGGGGTLLFGDVMQQVFELEPGQKSDWIPVENLDQIYVRTTSGASVVAFLGTNQQV